MSGRTTTVLDIRELLRHLREGRSSREIHRSLGLGRETIRKYRHWAATEGWLSGPLPALAELQARLAASQPPAPPQTVSSVEPHRATVQDLLDQGLETQAIYQRLKDAHGFSGHYQADMTAPPRAAGGGRTIESLLAAAELIKRDAAKQKAAASEKRRIADLEKLAQTEEQAWQTVDALLAEKRWKAHGQAVTQLQQVRDLADCQKTRVVFNRRVKQLRAKHQSRAALMKRFDKAGLA